MALPAPAGKTCALIALGLFFNTGYLCLTVFEQMVCQQHLWQQDLSLFPTSDRIPGSHCWPLCVQNTEALKMSPLHY